MRTYASGDWHSFDEVLRSFRFDNKLSPNDVRRLVAAIPMGADMVQVDQYGHPIFGAPLSDADINNRFGFHKATIEGPEATKPLHSMLRQAFMAFVKDLNVAIPSGRYQELCMDSLEQAAMWAHKAVAERAPLEEQSSVEDHTEQTMHKVYKALLDGGADGDMANAQIREMQGEGILFREIITKH